MSITVAGYVKNGVVVPIVPLPEGAPVEICLKEVPAAAPQASVCSAEMPAAKESVSSRRVTPAELRKMPREERQTVLAAAAELAEQDYRDGTELTGFEAFAEEELDDDSE